MIKETERVHEELYRAHWELTAGAGRLHSVLVSLYANSRHSDTRSKLAPIIAQLEQARDMADSAWDAAGKARTDLIGLTGCDGACSKRGEAPVKHHGVE